VRRLILSDLHANWEALESVAAHAAGSYDEIVCLGDLAGYGASPREVIDWAREHCALIVRGNHDKAVCGLDSMENFNDMARAAVEWSRAQLDESRVEWLRGLPEGPLLRGGAEFAHGSPLDEDGYLLMMTDARMLFEGYHVPLCFVGHSHLQGGFRHGQYRLERLPRPEPFQSETLLRIEEEYHYLVNPGSVGQPRDLDPRAAYAIWDDEAHTVRYRRAEYDVERAVRRILEAGLPPLLADRLLAGR
jgi:diadenosine tetraphosphatase ApaH/serine/threonine PP2A family protein phosphatase